MRLLEIAPQNSESHYAFSCRLDLRFPLLVDSDRSVARNYGVVLPFGLHRRSTFVIDHGGVIRYQNRAGLVGYLKASAAREAVAIAASLVAGTTSGAP